MVPSIATVFATIAAAAGRGRGAVTAARGRSPSPVARTPTRRGVTGRATNASAVLRPIVADVVRDEPAGIGGPAIPVMRRGVRPARPFDLATPPRAAAPARERTRLTRADPR